ncbi:MAG: DUF998 domain-containing protein [Candidatus Thorarchaeota archaeon]
MEQVGKFKNIPRVNQIGFLSPFVSFICIAITTSILPGFDWVDNPLSDLGSWFRTDLGEFQILSAILFNGGLIFTGGLAAYVLVCFMKQSSDLPTKIGLLLFTGTSLLLAAVGIFSEDFQLPHGLTAVLFFLSIPIGPGLVGLAWLRFSETRIYGFSSIVFSLISILIMFQPWIEFSIAVFEILEAFVVLGWMLFMNYLHYSGRLAYIFPLQDTQ